MGGPRSGREGVSVEPMTSVLQDFESNVDSE